MYVNTEELFCTDVPNKVASGHFILLMLFSDLFAKFLFLNFPPSAGPEKGLFDDMTDDEVLVLQQMFFGVVICALATLAAKGDMVFTAIFIGGVAAMAGYWLTEKGDYMLDGFLKGR